VSVLPADLGWSEADLGRYPWARFWNPRLAPLPAEVVQALAVGAVAAALLPAFEAARSVLFEGASLPDHAFALAPGGEMRVTTSTDMPGVTPAMIDWWFGWHGDSAERYRLWHPAAHVRAVWFPEPPPGTSGRARYVGRASHVVEYIGSRLIEGSIHFVDPATVGLDHPTLHDGSATLVCARTGPVSPPVDIGWLAHHVVRTPEGSRMRSLFWFGGAHLAGRSLAGALAVPVARRTLRFGEADARALIVHCVQEMNHLASFLPALYAQEGPVRT
jgi:hypothetical protein